MSSALDPRAKELIGRALRGERRLPRDRHRVHRAVLLAVGAAGVTGAKAAIAGAGAIAWLKAAPVVVVAGALAVAGVDELRSSAAPREAPAIVKAGTTPLAKAADLAPARDQALPVGEPVQSTAPVETALRRASSLKPFAAGSNKAPSALPVDEAAPPEGLPSLAAELESLQRAQRALNRGDGAGALAELARVEGSALLAERTALEVFALCSLGRADAARQKAALFRKLAPNSPLLPRVNASCAAE